MHPHLKRLAGLSSATVIAAALACADRGATVTGLPATAQRGDARATTELRAGSVIGGGVVASAYTNDGISRGGRLFERESGRYTAILDADGSGEAQLALSGRVTPVTFAASANVVRRAGRWEHHAPRVRGKPDRLIRVTATGGAPPSRLEFVQDGRVVATIATEWARARHAWFIRRRVISLHKDGVAARTLELVFDEPRSDRVSVPLAAPSLTIATVAPPDAASFDSGPCQAEFDAVYDSLDVWLLADLGLFGCLAGPKYCFAAIVGLFAAARQVDVAEERLDRCLAAL
ncbi:MAG TPA: hypothetical protein VJL28_03835 [Gemmatimonadaceae bacterium]|nr:hypothetical protein [Gemmatimonadaceae bacterium]